MFVVDEPLIDDWKDMEMFWCEYLRELGFKLFNKRSRNGLTYANSKTFKPGQTPWNKGLKLKERNKNKNSVPSGGLPGYYPVTNAIEEPVDDLPF